MLSFVLNHKHAIQQQKLRLCLPPPAVATSPTHPQEEDSGVASLRIRLLHRGGQPTAKCRTTTAALTLST